MKNVKEESKFVFGFAFYCKIWRLFDRDEQSLSTSLTPTENPPISYSSRHPYHPMGHENHHRDGSFFIVGSLSTE